MNRRFFLLTFLSAILAVSTVSSLSGLNVAKPIQAAPSPPFSWNPLVPCTPKIVRLSDITANQTGRSSFAASQFTPGITTSVHDGDAKRWLTPGPTPPGWVSPGPSCTVTNSQGTTSLFVQIDGVRRNSLVNEDNTTLYDPTNGLSHHNNTWDTTFDLFDPTIAPQAESACATSTDPTCYGVIHSEIDHDWKGAGYCGMGTVCDNATLASQTNNSTLLDVQGFIYWDNGSSTFAWHHFSGWELHPLTAWRPSSTVTFSTTPNVPQPGQPVTFTATSNGTTPSSYGWDFGDGVTASGKTVSHIYLTAKAFSVHVTMTDTQGIIVSSTKVVNVGGSWNPAVSCEPAQTTLEGAIGTVSIQRIPSDPNSIGADYSGGGFKLKGNLTYGSNPTTWPFDRTSLQPPCTVNRISAFVEFHNVTFTDINVSNCRRHYTTANGGGPYPNGWQSCDTTFNLITPGYGDPSTCPTCYMHKIYGGIDADWNASGVAPYPRPTDGQRIDAQGFIFWNHDAVNTTWHSFSGWEIHPLTAWRPTRPRITAGASFTPATPVAGQSVTFTGTAAGGTGPYTFYWDFGEGNVTKGNPISHVFGIGTYNIHMGANDSLGNLGAASRVVTVSPPPDFSIVINPTLLTLPAKSSRATSVNVTSIFGFAGNVSLAYVAPIGIGGSLAPKSVVLSAGGSASSTLTLTPSAAGNYSIKVTGTSGFLSHSANVTLRVTDAPPTVSFAESATNVVRDQPITLTITASDSDGTITSLKVDWGDGTVHSLPGNATGDSHAYVKAGSFTVNVTATDNAGLSASATAVKTVTDTPPVARFTESLTTASTGTIINFNASTSFDPDGTITGYTWRFGDGSMANGVTASHAYATAGSYTVILTVTDNATLTGNTTSTKTITDRPPTVSFTESSTTAPTGTPITIAISASDPDGTITSFIVSWGDGTVDTLPGSATIDSHAYSNTGSALSKIFNVYVNATDNSGSTTKSGAATKTVTDRSPTARFTESSTSALTAVNISFNATASSDPDGTITNYTWAFGDGGTGTGAIVSHSYANTGSAKTKTFTVTLTVTDNSGNTGNATASKTITDRNPTAVFTETATSALTGTSISFNATASSDPDGTITNYSWAFGDGGTATGAAVSHSYASTGIAKTHVFTVILNVTDNSGNTGSTTSTKTIIDRNPTASFTESTSATLTGVNISFNATSSSDPDGAITSYAWSFGDSGTGTGRLVTHSYTNTGATKTAIFKVTLNVTDNSGNTGSTTSTKTITDRNPTASFTESATSALTGALISFNATSSSDPDGTIASYAWNFGDGGTGTGAVVTHSYVNTGSAQSKTFNVTLAVTDNSGNTATAQATKTITDRIPNASFTESATSALTGVSIIFNATSSSDPDGTIASYNWNFGDGSFGTGAIVSHSYSSTGAGKTELFPVSLLVIDDSGNSGTTSSFKTITDRNPIASFTESATSALTGVSITFNATGSSDPDGTVSSYSWKFGDGSTGTGPMVSHSYASTGNVKNATFTVMLTVTDNSGNNATATSTKTIIDRNPTASFTESVTSALTGVNISFNATASRDPDGTITSYAWTFGDGGTATGAIVSHSYINTGNTKTAVFNVTLTVTDNSGKTGNATSIKTISDRSPVARFTESTTSTLTRVSISFNATTSSDTDGAIAIYAWNFGDGSTGTGAVVTHAYANTGNAKSATFNVTLTVTDNSGNTGTATSTKTIIDRNPVASFTESVTSALTGLSITFNATASSDPDGTIAAYTWNFGDGGTGEGLVVTHSYANTGNAKSATFNVTLTVTDNSGNTGITTSTKTIIDRNPTASFTESTTSGGVGVPITFNAGASADPDGTVSSYAWAFGDGATATGVTASHTYAITGTFTVTLNVTDNSGNLGTTTSTKIIAPDEPPIASFTESTTSALTGVSISFNASASVDPDGHIVSYAWNFGDGTPNGTGVTTTHSYANTGNAKTMTFTVTLTITDNATLTRTASSTKTITDRNPTASFTESATSTLSGVNISFNATASVDPDGAITIYAWNFGDGATGTGKTVSHTYANTGNLKVATFTVTLTVTDNSGNAGNTTSTKTIIDREPIATFTESQTTASTGVSISFNATASNDPDGTISFYSWTFGDGGTGIGAIVTHAYANAGNARSATFNVTLTVTDNSGNTARATSTKTIIDRGPTAIFTESTTSALTGIGITFNGTSSVDPDGVITTYSWNFGDGGTGTDPVMTHSYANTGNAKTATFKVTLTVTDNSGNTGNTTSTKAITDRSPTASFTESATFALTGVNISFNATGSSDPDGSIQSYSWTFGDGGKATGALVSHAYTNTGNLKLATFTVMLNVTDNSGNTGIAQSTKTITDRNPVASFTESVTSAPTGVSINFNATVSNDPDGSITSYAWNFGDGGTGTGKIVSHTYTNTGGLKVAAFNVTLTVTDNSGNTAMASSTKTITDGSPIASFTESVTAALTGVSISFNATASSDPDGTISSYAWNFGDGTVGTGKIAAHVYATTGSAKTAPFTVILNVTDNAGNSGTAQSTKTITDQNPTARFTESVTAALTGTTINFNATTSSDPDGTITSYSWSFGDGGTGTGPIVTHSYANIGNLKVAPFTVILTVTDNSGNTAGALSSKIITDRAPVASFTESTTVPTVNIPVTFNATASSDPDGTIVGYAWNFGDGTTGTGITVTHTFISTGTATVVLNVTDNSGNTARTSSTKTILDENPTARFTETVTSALTGVSIGFNATASSDPDGRIVSYAWNFGDGSPIVTLTNPLTSHTYASTGNQRIAAFIVTLMVTDNGTLAGTAQATKSIADRPPTASFTESTTGALTSTSISFNATASTDPDGTITAYSWNFGDGSTGVGKIVSHNYANTSSFKIATFTVTLNVTDNSGSTGTTQSTKTITDRNPTASFTESTTTALTGVSITFNATASIDPDGSLVSYMWNYGDGTKGTGRLPGHAYAKAGSYTVTLNVTDNSGNTASATSTKTIQDRPPVASSSESSTRVLTSISITFNATSSYDIDGTIVGYAWNFGDGSTPASGVTATHSYALAGNYTVVLSVTDNSGLVSSASVVETVLDRPPTASFAYSPASPLTGQTINFDASPSFDPDGTIASYVWNFGDSITGTGAKIQHSYATNGTFTVLLTVVDNSGSKGNATGTVRVGNDPAPVFSLGSVLTASNIDAHILTLTWTPANDSVQVTGYRIYGNGTLLVTVPGSTTSYKLIGLAALTHYLFVVQAGNPSGNYSTNGPSTIAFTRLRGDVNLDCRVDVSDLSLVGASFGSKLGDPRYNPNADLDKDGIIDVSDLTVVGSNFGRVC